MDQGYVFLWNPSVQNHIYKLKFFFRIMLSIWGVPENLKSVKLFILICHHKEVYIRTRFAACIKVKLLENKTQSIQNFVPENLVWVRELINSGQIGKIDHTMRQFWSHPLENEMDWYGHKIDWWYWRYLNHVGNDGCWISFAFTCSLIFILLKTACLSSLIC